MVDAMEIPDKPSDSKAGAMVREAREARGVNAADLCTSLRISKATLEAIEAGQYASLPGDPYVRALLGSIARSLHMDSQKLLRAYNNENGRPLDSNAALPYTDDSEAHILSHRKIFIGLLAVLLIALLFILGKVNSSSEKIAAPTAPPQGETFTVAIPTPDTLLESPSLRPDSGGMGSSALYKKDTAALDKDKTSRVTLKALIDNMEFRAYRKGWRPVAETLAVGASKQLNFRDTVTVVLGKTMSVAVTFGDTTIIPVRRAFKIFGRKLSYL